MAKVLSANDQVLQGCRRARAEAVAQQAETMQERIQRHGSQMMAAAAAAAVAASAEPLVLRLR